MFQPMRFGPAILACSLVPAAAAAGNRAGEPPGASTVTNAPVIGGDSAKPGKWPDVAAILFPAPAGEEARCTGTLVAPAIVLTAGHCYDSFDLPDNVLIGTSSLASPDQGETIAIKRGFQYPDSDTTEDLTVLVLARPSSRAPRPIATGWARGSMAGRARAR